MDVVIAATCEVNMSCKNTEKGYLLHLYALKNFILLGLYASLG